MAFHVKCKKCGARIEVASKPTGGTNVSNVRAFGPVNISGGSISFGPGGGIAFGEGGAIAFGPAPSSRFTCMECGQSNDYSADEITEG
jgi:ribosomal protein S27E